MKLSSRLMCRLMAGAAVVCFGGEAFAQTEAPANSAALDEIVVTARKRAEDLTDVPVAITALTGDALAARQINTFSELQNYAPSFRYQEASSSLGNRAFNVFSIRGMFPGTDSPDRQAVSIFIDGIPVGGGGSVPGLTDVQQVEIVNGPQSAYFGRSTFSGAVNFITRNPGDEFRAGFVGSYSSYDSHELTGQVEGPIIEGKLSARISGRSWTEGAQYESFGYGQDLGRRTSKSVGLTLYATPIERLRIKAYGTKWLDKDGPAASGLLVSADYNCNARGGAGPLNYFCGPISSVPPNRISQTPISTSDMAFLQSQNKILGADFIDGPGFRREAHMVALSGELDLPYGLTLSANGSQSQNEWAHVTDLGNRFSPGLYSTFIAVYDIENSTAEVRLASDSSKPLNFIVGANSYQQSVVFNASSVRPNLLRPGATPTRTITDTAGYFAAVSYTLFDKLQLSAEGRYQLDKISAATTAPGARVSEGTTKSFTPRLIARYDLTPDVNVYGSYAKGTRPAQFNANVYALAPADFATVQRQATVPLKVPEEQLSMYELGLKGRFFNDKLQILAAAYYGRWTDKQVSVTLFYGAQLQLPVVLPNGEVTLRGAELQATLTPFQGMTIEATAAYAGTKIISTTCPECNNITGVVNPVGNRLPRYPAYSGSLSATYERPVFADYTGFVRTDYTYQGRMYDTEANVAWTPPAHRVNLRFGVRNDRYSAEIFGRNIFNNKTPLSIARSADQYNASNTMILGVPVLATYGVRASVNF